MFGLIGMVAQTVIMKINHDRALAKRILILKKISKQNIDFEKRKASLNK